MALEGWLVGPWVDELRKETEVQLSGAKGLTLDFAKVLFVDPPGVALLRELAERHGPHQLRFDGDLEVPESHRLSKDTVDERFLFRIEGL